MSLTLRLFSLVALAGLLLGSSGAGTLAPTAADMDRTCPACKDFYQHATGGWRKRNPVPAAHSSWSQDSLIQEKIHRTLRAILEDAARRADDADPNTRRIGMFYRTCMDTAAIEAAGIEPLSDGLAAIAAVRDRRGIVDAAARINLQGGSALFTFTSAQDLNDSTRVIGELDQGGLALPDRDYYFRTDAKSRRLLASYRGTIAAQFVNLGDSPDRAKAEAAAVVSLETKLARTHFSNVEVRDPKALHHPTSLRALRRLAPNVDWTAYFKQLGAPPMTHLNVGVPQSIAAVSKELAATPVAAWKSYLRWMLVDANAAALPARFDQTNFRFYGTALHGQKEELPRWERCVAATDRALGEALGRAFVHDVFPPAAKARARALVDNLQATLRAELASSAWLSKTARLRAVAKLDLLVKKIGYPDHWRDYSAMDIRAVPFVVNAAEAHRFELTRELAKIGRPLDRSEWLLTPATDNAYYDPQLNEIVFPAAILQPPYFSLKAEDAQNYGEIGATFGHEMTHGFDEDGRLFDGYGNLRNWWLPSDVRAWSSRIQCIVDQADRYVAPGNLHLDGKLVSGEATADLGGLVVAYRAFERAQAGRPRIVRNGLTPEQRFFVAFANSWATNYTPALARYLVESDVHPVASYRVNGTVGDMPEFAAAFGCKARDPMVQNPQCKVW